MAVSKECKECRGISVPLPGLTSCGYNCSDVPPPSHGLGLCFGAPGSFWLPWEDTPRPQFVLLLSPGQGQHASSSAGAEGWPEAPCPAPQHEPGRLGWEQITP